MDLNTLQKKVDDWIKKYGIRYFDELTNMAQLTEEVGEVARIISRTYGEQSIKENEELNTLWSSARLKFDNYSLVKKRNISSNEFQPLLTVDIGLNSELDINDVLLSSKGLIGKVVSIGLYSAEIMLVHDVRSSVPVVSDKSKLHGNIRGNGIGRLGKVKYIKKTAPYQIGEKFYTSGVAGIYPEGIFVGEIVAIDDLVDEEFLEVQVSLCNRPSIKIFI